MQKDYYKILELPASASLPEIKAAYRRLAQQFHPDKNNNDLYASARFEIIKEAYEVLSNPTKKEYYLQQRWYDRSINRKQTEVATTPVSILKQVLELEKYLSRADIHRMDTDGLFDYLVHTYSTGTIEILNKFDETEMNETIIRAGLSCLGPLPYDKSVIVVELLTKIKSPGTEESLQKFLRQAKMAHTWNQLRAWVIVVIVLLLCILIVWVGGNGD